VLVHINREQAPIDYVFIEADIPDDAIETLDVAILPKGWQGEPPLVSLRAIGDGWVRSNSALALRVPSVVVPEESNVLINPGHPRSGELRIVGAPRPAILDPRLLS
jgi:RES domain-containing protein